MPPNVSLNEVRWQQNDEFNVQNDDQNNDPNTACSNHKNNELNNAQGNGQNNDLNNAAQDNGQPPGIGQNNNPNNGQPPGIVFHWHNFWLNLKSSREKGMSYHDTRVSNLYDTVIYMSR